MKIFIIYIPIQIYIFLLHFINNKNNYRKKFDKYLINQLNFILGFYFLCLNIYIIS